jgi:hypothetical protein
MLSEKWLPMAGLVPALHYGVFLLSLPAAPLLTARGADLNIRFLTVFLADERRLSDRAPGFDGHCHRWLIIFPLIRFTFAGLA